MKPSKQESKKSGYILVFFIMLSGLSLLLATSILSFQGAVLRDAKKISFRLDSGYLAQAGLDKGFLAYKTNQSYAGETLNLGNGSVVTSVTAGSTANEKILSAVGTVGGVTRRYRAKLTTQASGTAVAFNYGMQIGAGGFVMGNNSIINGSVYSNQNIVGGNGSQVNGDAFAVGSITNVVVTGTSQTGVPPEPMPPFDGDFWRTKAMEGTNITGNYSPASGSTIGPLYVSGDITFDNNVDVTIAGPVYANGQITFGNSPILRVSNNTGTSGVMMVAGSNVTFGNGLTAHKNSGGGYLLIVGLSSSSSAISMGNSVIITNAPLYAPNGTITMGNSAQGTAFTGWRIQTGNGAIINYDEGLANASFSSGPGGSWQLQKGTFQEY